MTTYTYQEKEYSEKVLREISAIRDGGYVNMFDRRGVIHIAEQIGFESAIDALEQADGAEYIQLLEAMNDFDETKGLRSGRFS